MFCVTLVNIAPVLIMNLLSAEPCIGVPNCSGTDQNMLFSSVRFILMVYAAVSVAMSRLIILIFNI